MPEERSDNTSVKSWKGSSTRRSKLVTALVIDLDVDIGGGSLVHMPERGDLRADGVHLLHDEVLRAHLAGQVRHRARQRHHVRLQALEALVYTLEHRGNDT